MKRDYRRYIDSEGWIHAAGPAIAVNSGLCANNDNVDDTDEPVTCRVCLAVDAYVRKHRVPASPVAVAGGGA